MERIRTKLPKKESIINTIISTKITVRTIIDDLTRILTKQSPYGEEKYYIPLRCECIERNSESSLFFGCTDKHMFDMATIPYFTLGVLLPFPYTFTLLLALCKLIRTCGVINKFLYVEEMVRTKGTLRRYQTLLNMIGDILAFLIGHFFSANLSSFVLIFIIVFANIAAVQGGRDIISMFIWWKLRLDLLSNNKNKYDSLECESPKPNFDEDSPKKKD